MGSDGTSLSSFKVVAMCRVLSLLHRWEGLTFKIKEVPFAIYAG